MQLQISRLRGAAASVVFCAAAILVSRPVVAAPQPGILKGKALDSAGKPLANAVISITGIGSKIGFEETSLKTSATGTYSKKINADATYHLSASAVVSYGGKVYTLPLHPTDNKTDSSDAKKGIEKDFVWKLTGPKVGTTDETNPFSYYGANVRLSHFQPYGSLVLTDSTTFKFTLTPTDKLADGSTGKTLVFQRTLQDLEPGMKKPLGKSNVLHDIPLGTYKMTAIAVVPGRGEVPMLLGARPGTTEPVEVTFPPSQYGGIDGAVLMLTNPTE